MRDYIKTIQPGGKVGPLVNQKVYNEIKEFIIKTILDTENCIEISKLINICFSKFEPIYKDQAGILIYNIKKDIEARGLINHEYLTKQISVIKTTQLQYPKNERLDTGIIDHYNNPVVNKSVKEKFIELFSKNPLISFAPGRINIMGEHTDYNDGLVIPAAIKEGIQFAIATSNNSSAIIYSIKYNQYLAINLKNLKKVRNSKWQNYLLGVLVKLNKDGYKLKPFNCAFDGDLPVGSGLASSASLECGFVVALNELFALQLTRYQMIEIAHWAEINYVKVKCGIMDQFVSIMGKPGNLIFLDCQSLKHTYYPLQLKDYCFLLCDTKVKHSHSTSVYNKRIDECRKSVEILQSRFPEIHSLRNVTYEMLLEMKEPLRGKLFKRCKFVIEENARVEKASTHLIFEDLIELGKTMYESHEGLSTLFDVSCDELDFLVDFTKNYEGILGSRMMGGGFGGCTLNLIHNNTVGTFTVAAMEAYKTKFHKKLNCEVIQISHGASILENPYT